MESIITICRGYVIFLSCPGFLFGQLFFGNFEWHATIAGTFGLLAGSLASKKCLTNRTQALFVISFCALGVVGVGLNAFHYYKYLNSSGNHYAWFLIGPHVACLAVILCYMLIKLPPNQQLKAGETPARDAASGAP